MDVAASCCPLCNTSVIYDSMQLNRVETMICTLLQVLCAGNPNVDSIGVGDQVNTNACDAFAPSLPEPGHCSTIQVVDEKRGSTSKSSKTKQRRMRVKHSRSQMWIRLQAACAEKDAGVAIPCSAATVDRDAHPDALTTATVAEKIDLTTIPSTKDAHERSPGLEVESSDAIVCAGTAKSDVDIYPDVGGISGSSTSRQEGVLTLSVELDSEVIDKNEFEAVRQAAYPEGAKQPEVVDVNSAESKTTPPPDTKLLQSLRGQPKHEAILNLFLNRTCTCDNYKTTLSDMKKYFKDDLQYLAKFLGTKFGIGCKSWDEIESVVENAIAADAQWTAGLTLGMVLAEQHRQKSDNTKKNLDRASQLTNRVAQPRKSKHKRGK